MRAVDCILENTSQRTTVFGQNHEDEQEHDHEPQNIIQTAFQASMQDSNNNSNMTSDEPAVQDLTLDSSKASVSHTSHQ